MMLSGPRIEGEYYAGNIIIDPFCPSRVGPNSYDLTLFPELKVYDDLVLDARACNSASSVFIEERGYRLDPGRVYIAQTNEMVGVPERSTRGIVPGIEGRSSVGRLGLDIHATAGFGDDGFVGRWTLELSVKQSLRIYPNMPIAQAYFIYLEGDRRPYRGSYQGQEGPTISELFARF